MKRNQMELDEILAVEVSALCKNQTEVGEALTDLSDEQYAVIDGLVFQALQRDPTNWDSEQLEAIGRAMCEAVIDQFERRVLS